jgi:hypothetical protein
METKIDFGRPCLSSIRGLAPLCLLAISALDPVPGLLVNGVARAMIDVVVSPAICYPLDRFMEDGERIRKPGKPQWNADTAPGFRHRSSFQLPCSLARNGA